MATIKGVHLIGSIQAPDAESAMRRVCTGLPGRLKRVPDGETGSRNYFTLWQYYLFKVAPQMMVSFEDNTESAKRVFTDEEVDEGIEQLKKAGIETGYDDAAIESYAVFKRLRDEGVIPQGVKFQVGIPSVASVVSVFVEAAFQPKVYPIYEEALFRALRVLQDKIPHEDLAIQLDLAVDTAFWEGAYLTPWFKDKFNVKDYVTEYLLRMIEHVDQDVELGIHNCYGDMNHQHWFEPTSLRAVVDRGLRLFEKSSHKINWFHLPVPVSTMETLEAFLAPLSDLVPKLKENNTDLVLGLVQYDDEGGTRKRIDAASKFVSEFEIATECGWGRTPEDQIDNIMELSCGLSQPVS
ncbi:hypothetical protein M409DRAFT_63175 [Zasmidium cellare ATCC 36951]|uniref:Cobalamin-independent methionine synthase MetE C-terminal/archaeal domain-containing protein n=1 Tax=Zasmidium cellare ATCC 36951 TaxID=1080233 RepID=A0A6A6D2V7_ZASCE|nr:uncharacterized protein M409DRAFT_63175 [Zasmidium cellare ATCC 36951]KAF2172512.1 hypothetical protein M409DRAFT_63175 [Zasmidium cellare ATCC 36951]